MQRILIEIEYKGTDFCGWQKQKSGRSVQAVLENVLANFYKCKISLNASGRTDRGVHALSQMAHFDAEAKPNFDVSNLPAAINSFLPDDIKLKSARLVNSEFHARFNVYKKNYIYLCYISDFESPLKNEYMMRIKSGINIKNMIDASKIVLGKHDFSAFKSAGSNVLDNVRKIYSFKIKQSGDIVSFEICGNGFLYNMVRNIVGTLLDVGYGKLKTSEFDDILKTRIRTRSKTAAACGLYLKSVKYKNYA